MRGAERRRRGATLIEVAVVTSIAGAILLVAGTILRGTTGISQSTNNIGASATRAQGALQKAADVLRKASLATVQSQDGTPFSDGEAGSWIRFRTVTGYDGAITLSQPVILRFDRAVGAETGNVVLDDGVRPRILAREVTTFTIVRAGTLFTITCSARSGPADDGRRTTTGSVVASPRNP